MRLFHNQKGVREWDWVQRWRRSCLREKSISGQFSIFDGLPYKTAEIHELTAVRSRFNLIFHLFWTNKAPQPGSSIQADFFGRFVPWMISWEYVIEAGWDQGLVELSLGWHHRESSIKGFNHKKTNRAMVKSLDSEKILDSISTKSQSHLILWSERQSISVGWSARLRWEAFCRPPRQVVVALVFSQVRTEAESGFTQYSETSRTARRMRGETRFGFW